MQTITRKIGDFDDLMFEVDLTKYGKTGADVSDIIFSVKKDLTDADDSLLQKKYSIPSEVTFTGTKVLDVLVQWADTEYSPFSPGTEYKAGLFIKFAGDPVADEHVDGIFDVVIEQDFLRA